MSIQTPSRLEITAGGEEPADRSRRNAQLRRSAPAMTKSGLVVGGQPRADLLPPEIVAKRKQLKVRRRLRAGVLLVGVAVAAGAFGAVGMSTLAQAQLAASQATLQTLLA